MHTAGARLLFGHHLPVAALEVLAVVLAVALVAAAAQRLTPGSTLQKVQVEP